MKWGLWSTTAASNSATPPDGWPEGQAPSTVNDCAREMMAAVATGLQDIQFVDLGYVPTQTSGNTFTVSGTHADTLHYGRRLKLSDGANTFYATIISATATTNTAVALRFDTGNAPLDASLSAVAVGAPSQSNAALPENVYRYENYLDNSQFEIWQRGYTSHSVSAGTSVSNRCYADRWFVNFGVASSGPVLNVFPAARSANASNVPALAQCGVLLNTSFAVSVGTALTGIVSADSLAIMQRIEGNRWRQIAHKPNAMSVWVRSGVTGTYCMTLNNTNNDQSFVTEYQITAADTWEKKTFTIPPAPTAGTWDYSVGIGLQVRFMLASGGALKGGAGNWTATVVLATVNQTNFFANAGKNFMISAVWFGEGEQPQALSPTRYNEELVRAQRYVFPFAGNAFGFCANSLQALVSTPFPNYMRGASISSSSLVALSNMVLVAVGIAASVSAIVAASITNSNALLQVNAVGTPFAQGTGVRMAASSGSTTQWILFKAEL